MEIIKIFLENGKKAAIPIICEIKVPPKMVFLLRSDLAVLSDEIKISAGRLFSQVGYFRLFSDVKHYYYSSYFLLAKLHVMAGVSHAFSKLPIFPNGFSCLVKIGESVMESFIF